MNNPSANFVNGVTVAIDGAAALAVATPERPDPVALSGALTLPPLSIAKHLRNDAMSTRVGRRSDLHIVVEVAAAVSTLLRTRRYQGVRIERVALRIKGVRTSLYRRWSSKRHLVAFAVVSQMSRDPAPDTGSLRGDLEAAVPNLVAALTESIG